MKLPISFLLNVDVHCNNDKISFVKKAGSGLFAFVIKTYGCLFNNVFDHTIPILNNVKENCY